MHCMLTHHTQCMSSYIKAFCVFIWILFLLLWVYLTGCLHCCCLPRCVFHCSSGPSPWWPALPWLPALSTPPHSAHTHTHTEKDSLLNSLTSRHIEYNNNNNNNNNNKRCTVCTCMSSCREKKGSTVADSLAPCLCSTDRSSPPNTSLTGDSLNDVCVGRGKQGWG